jgi:hypothetical protein
MSRRRLSFRNELIQPLFQLVDTPLHVLEPFPKLPVFLSSLPVALQLLATLHEWWTVEMEDSQMKLATWRKWCESSVATLQKMLIHRILKGM